MRRKLYRQIRRIASHIKTEQQLDAVVGRCPLPHQEAARELLLKFVKFEEKPLIHRPTFRDMERVH